MSRQVDRTQLIFTRSNFCGCLLAFGIAIPLGLFFSLNFPQAAQSYVLFVQARVFTTMGTPSGIHLGIRQVFIIILHNLVPVALGFVLPPAIVAYSLAYAKRRPEKYRETAKYTPEHASAKPRRLSSELYLDLSLFGYALAFGFGFFVFGVFFGFLFRLGGLVLLEAAIRDIGFHAPFEVVAILMSASTALGLRDEILTKEQISNAGNAKLGSVLLPLVRSRRMAVTLALAVAMIVLGAFVEVYVSAPLAGVGLNM